MVHLIDGQAHPGHFPRDGAAYQRRAAAFRVEAPPAAESQPLPEGKYLLVVCAACPWAHRALLVRQLKGLTNLGLAVVSPYRDDEVGWAFVKDDAERQRLVDKFGPSIVAPTPDLHSGLDADHLYELYLAHDPKYTGTITTPTLFDIEAKTIVSNESWDIIRFLDRAFDPGLEASVHHSLYPEEQADAIDSLAKRVQDDLNNGVYRCGLARSQDAHEAALDGIFAVLDELEEKLGHSRFLVDRSEPSVADLQLFVTLVRFDDVYYILFKTSRRRLRSYANLSNYLRDVYQLPGVAETVDATQIKEHYFTNFDSANPSGTVPRGSMVPSLLRSHDRITRFAARDAAAKAASAVEATQVEQNADAKARGEFVRGISGHRRIVTADGAGEGELPAASGRYHLFVAENCPWCHRVLLARAVLGLEDVISADVLFYRRHAERGWQFLPPDEELRDWEIAQRATLLDGVVATASTVLPDIRYMPDLYAREGSAEKSVPILFDKQEMKIVNNESAEIVRMLGLGFRAFQRAGAPELYPEHLRSEVDELNSWIYQSVNNGAYRAGFSSNQEAYEQAYAAYFAAVDRLEAILAERRFLTGEAPTEADVRLFPTMYRHDPVYYARMKLNGKMVRDCPHLHRWLRDMLAQPGVRAASNLAHCVYGYFGRTGNNLVPEVGEPDAGWR